jgi:hypothetical protein
MSSKVKDFNSYYFLEDAVVRDTFQQCFDNTRDLQSQVDSILAGGGGGGSYVLPSATTQVLGGIIVGSGLSVTSTGVLSVSATVSDERMKQDISDSTLGLDFILTLQPKQFRYRPDINGESTDLNLSYGFIAQDIKALIDTGLNWNGWNEGTTPNPNPNWEADNEPEYLDTPQSLDYEMFIAPLVKAVQQQNQLIQELSARVADLESAY